MGRTGLYRRAASRAGEVGVSGWDRAYSSVADRDRWVRATSWLSSLLVGERRLGRARRPFAAAAFQGGRLGRRDGWPLQSRFRRACSLKRYVYFTVDRGLNSVSFVVEGAGRLIPLLGPFGDGGPEDDDSWRARFRRA